MDDTEEPVDLVERVERVERVAALDIGKATLEACVRGRIQPAKTALPGGPHLPHHRRPAPAHPTGCAPSG